MKGKESIKTIDDIIKTFYDEFGSITNKFVIITLKLDEAKNLKEKYLSHPGVYVWYNFKKGPIKVGRHLINARRRALEHIRDNTAGIMKAICEDKDTILILFNVKDQKDIHWVAALEIFLEKSINPLIKSNRLG